MTHNTPVSDAPQTPGQTIVVTHKTRFRWEPYADKKVISRRGPGRWTAVDPKTGDWATAILPDNGTFVVED